MVQPALPGAASIATSSSATSPRLGRAAELALLLGAGALAVLLHEAFRWPLRLPGHHGLEWLAILMSARLLSARPGAALTVAMGAAATALLVGTGGAPGPRALIYLLQGAVLDALFLRLRGRGAWWMVALALGALVHAVSPLLKTLLQGPGVPVFGSLSQGLAYPLMTHAMFGAVGALAGALAVRSLRRAPDKPPT